MEFRDRARRILAGITGAAGLAYPACAAVCPRGRGGCPYPGRCFLYTDADANSVCDYTVSSSATPPGGAGTATTTPSPVPAMQDSGVSPGSSVAGTANPDLSGLIQQGAPFIGLVLFLLLCAALYRICRSGRFGPRLEKTGPALALSVFISLGTAEIVTYLLMGDGASGSASGFAIVYLLAGTVLTSYLWKRGAISPGIAAALAAESTVFGVVLTVLIMPAEAAGILGAALGSRTVGPGLITVGAILLLTFLTGRTFCAHICPVGSAQELAYRVPVAKTVLRQTHLLERIRLGVVTAVVLAALYSIDLLAYAGSFEFFSLTVSAGSAAFAGLLALSAIVYRPVCRAICPFGLLFSLPAQVSRYVLRRTDACIGCKRCENACPAGVAGEHDPRRECYLCGRCTGACPARGALVYRERAGGRGN